MATRTVNRVIVSGPISPETFAAAERRFNAEMRRRVDASMGMVDYRRRYATGGIVGHPEATRWRRPTILRQCIHRLGRWLCRY